MKQTKQIMVRDVPIGGGAPIAVQSMTNTDTRDAKATLAQIHALAEAGCDIVRCAVPDAQAAEAPLPCAGAAHLGGRGIYMEVYCDDKYRAKGIWKPDQRGMGGFAGKPAH